MNSILYIDDNGKAELYDDDYNITMTMITTSRSFARTSRSSSGP